MRTSVNLICTYTANIISNLMQLIHSIHTKIHMTYCMIRYSQSWCSIKMDCCHVNWITLTLVLNHDQNDHNTKSMGHKQWKPSVNQYQDVAYSLQWQIAELKQYHTENTELSQNITRCDDKWKTLLPRKNSYPASYILTV